MLTRDLRVDMKVTGKLIVNLSTNLRGPDRGQEGYEARDIPQIPAGYTSNYDVTNPDPTKNIPPRNSGKENSKYSPFEDAQGQLPAGWERREDTLGRTYYVDHNTSTSWSRPPPRIDAST